MKLLPLKPPAIDLKFVIRYLKTAYEMKYAWDGMITRACLWMGDWQGGHRAAFVETVLGALYT